ncbi:lipoyl(octanoyl) transferase LipB [Chitinophaga silvatica]|uniref:lipoyl(octanoyl) transferase LipB n=1 Tax=Chitinophaga silvatica TaxID=2282649 RepID=UPI001F3940CE|nr:lipoyl(octanoyl) transferase LipB [Chitinophaga silvatica]
MEKIRQEILFSDLGTIDYQEAWDYQEKLLKQNVGLKSAAAGQIPVDTTNYLLFCEHPPVYTLGKSGHMENLLVSQEALKEQGIGFVPTNRGGDITFHGPGQIVGYPILDLEKFYTDIGKYLRNLEEVIIRTIAEYGLKGDRSAGETGVWLEPHDKAKARKICAMGVRCSRWVTMHGFALNVNTSMDYFNKIVPCGIQDKKVASLSHELGREIDINEVKEKLRKNFAEIFEANIIL